MPTDEDPNHNPTPPPDPGPHEPSVAEAREEEYEQTIHEVDLMSGSAAAYEACWGIRSASFEGRHQNVTQIVATLELVFRRRV